MKIHIFKSIVTIMLIATFFMGIAGCSGSVETLTFQGESKNWTAKYIFSINKKENSATDKLIIENKDSNEEIGIVNFKVYKNGELKVKAKMHPINGKMTSEGGGKNILMPDKNDKYVVEINWQGGNETFPLDYKNSLSNY